jgi:hypothetical protein
MIGVRPACQHHPEAIAAGAGFFRAGHAALRERQDKKKDANKGELAHVQSPDVYRPQNNAFPLNRSTGIGLLACKSVRLTVSRVPLKDGARDGLPGPDRKRIKPRHIVIF